MTIIAEVVEGTVVESLPHLGSSNLFFLQVGEVVTTIPTIGFNVEQVTYKNLKFQVWDLGGQTSIRQVTYFDRFIQTIAP